MPYTYTTEERIAEDVACRASNQLQQNVGFKRLVVEGQTYIRFYLLRDQDTGSSWPADLVRAAEDREADLAATVAQALHNIKEEKPVRA